MAAQNVKGNANDDVDEDINDHANEGHMVISDADDDPDLGLQQKESDKDVTQRPNLSSSGSSQAESPGSSRSGTDTSTDRPSEVTTRSPSPASSSTQISPPPSPPLYGARSNGRSNCFMRDSNQALNDIVELLREFPKEGVRLEDIAALYAAKYRRRMYPHRAGQLVKLHPDVFLTTVTQSSFSGIPDTKVTLVNWNPPASYGVRIAVRCSNTLDTTPPAYRAQYYSTALQHETGNALVQFLKQRPDGVPLYQLHEEFAMATGLVLPTSRLRIKGVIAKLRDVSVDTSDKLYKCSYKPRPQAPLSTSPPPSAPVGTINSQSVTLTPAEPIVKDPKILQNLRLLLESAGGELALCDIKLAYKQKYGQVDLSLPCPIIRYLEDDPYIGIVMRNNSHAVAYLKSPLVKISPPTAVSPPSPATSYISAVGKKDPTDVPQNTNGACQTPNCSLPGVLYCTGCRCFLCQDHNITIHSLLPSAVLEQHKRIAKQTEVESATNSPFQIPESARVCQIHSGEPRTVACMTCKELPILCKHCFISSHKGHASASLLESKQKSEAMINKCIAELSARAKEYGDYRSQLVTTRESVLKEEKLQTAFINTKILAIRNLLDAKESSLLDCVQQGKIAKIDEQMNSVNNWMNTASEGLKAAEKGISDWKSSQDAFSYLYTAETTKSSASSLVTAPRGSMLSLQVYPQFEGTLSSSSSIELAIKQFNFESKSSSLTPSPFEVPFFGCTLWDDSQQRTQNSNQPWRSSQSQYSPRASPNLFWHGVIRAQVSNGGVQKLDCVGHLLRGDNSQRFPAILDVTALPQLVNLLNAIAKPYVVVHIASNDNNSLFPSFVEHLIERGVAGIVPFGQDATIVLVGCKQGDTLLQTYLGLDFSAMPGNHLLALAVRNS